MHDSNPKNSPPSASGEFVPADGELFCGRRTLLCGICAPARVKGGGGGVKRGSALRRTTTVDDQRLLLLDYTSAVRGEAIRHSSKPCWASKREGNVIQRHRSSFHHHISQGTGNHHNEWRRSRKAHGKPQVCAATSFHLPPAHQLYLMFTRLKT